MMTSMMMIITILSMSIMILMMMLPPIVTLSLASTTIHHDDDDVNSNNNIVMTNNNNNITTTAITNTTNNTTATTSDITNDNNNDSDIIVYNFTLLDCHMIYITLQYAKEMLLLSTSQPPETTMYQQVSLSIEQELIDALQYNSLCKYHHNNDNDEQQEEQFVVLNNNETSFPSHVNMNTNKATETSRKRSKERRKTSSSSSASDRNTISSSTHSDNNNNRNNDQCYCPTNHNNNNDNDENSTSIRKYCILVMNYENDDCHHDKIRKRYYYQKSATTKTAKNNKHNNNNNNTNFMPPSSNDNDDIRNIHDDNDDNHWLTWNIHDAIQLSRTIINEPYNTMILLCPGIHILSSTIILNSNDSGLLIHGHNNKNNRNNATNNNNSKNNDNEKNYSNTTTTTSSWILGSIPISLSSSRKRRHNHEDCPNLHDWIPYHRHDEQEEEESVNDDHNSTITTTTFTTMKKMLSSSTIYSSDDEDKYDQIRQEELQQEYIYVINLANIIMNYQKQNQKWNMPKLASLFSGGDTSNILRYVRARYPNMNPELNLWGYNSPNKLLYSLPIENNVIEWHRRSPDNNISMIPTFIDYDLTKTTNNNNHIPIIKNDSAMIYYNHYGIGYNGICSTIWGNNGKSYWCSNISDGGWAEVDRECAITGQIQIPIRMTYNISTIIGQKLINHNHNMIGGIIHAWHSQSWSMHMFEIIKNDININTTSSTSSSSSSDDNDDNNYYNNISGMLYFTKGSGKQGGRNWCRCDQCTYAGNPYCKQYQKPIPDNTDQRLISGTWCIENILSELDIPSEFYFNTTTYLLYIYRNISSTTTTPTERYDDDDEITDNMINQTILSEVNNSDTIYNNRTATTSSTTTLIQEELNQLRFAMLETLINMENVNDITISNIGFRETLSTYMNDDWIVPSGGDWALYNGSVIYTANVTNITIEYCTFTKLDNNAILLYGYNRYVTIRYNRFEWLGENAIVLLGETNDDDAYTNINQPRYTNIEYNICKEIGIYQKQSSCISLNKACQTNISNNVLFNVPRAAINFNDMMGGDDIVMNNIIFNTCRESGDHGPINSWDRQPYYTDILHHNVPSFKPKRRIIRNNMIIANYNAGQGIDNDDGSSWYHIQYNVIYQSVGFKMDYGGHDSIYEHNVVIMYPTTKASMSDQLCINFQRFLSEHGHIARNNTCIASILPTTFNNILPTTSTTTNATTYHRPIINLEECFESHVGLYNNTYYTPDGIAYVRCGYDDEHNPLISFEDIQTSYGLEIGSTVSKTPPLSSLIQMVWDTLKNKS